jgi:hypothetical protein
LAQVERQKVGLRETQVEVRDLILLLLMVGAGAELILLIHPSVLAVQVSDLKAAVTLNSLS